MRKKHNNSIKERKTNFSVVIGQIHKNNLS
jgi:hypothetical protein